MVQKKKTVMKKCVDRKQIPHNKNTSCYQLSTVQQRSTFSLFGMLVFGVLGQRDDCGTCSCLKATKIFSVPVCPRH